jgi:hypothetical protein
LEDFSSKEEKFEQWRYNDAVCVSIKKSIWAERIIITMVVAGKHIYIYGEQSEAKTLVIINTFQGDGSGIYSALKGMTEGEICLGVVSDINWAEEMSPWSCPSVGKGEAPCTGGADKYLTTLTRNIVPAIRCKMAKEPAEIVIGGYSLAGLFAVYSLYKTAMFSRAISASGSMWFPGFKEYTATHVFCKKPDRVYFSLGDKEAKTKNPMLRTVEDRTREMVESYRGFGVDTVFEMNPGNHFKDPDIRLAKGILRCVT